MSEIKQVWGIIKDYQCADLEMVQGPALAVWKSQQAIIDDLKAQLSLQRDRNKALETELTSSRNYGDKLNERIRKVSWLLGNNSFERTIKNCLKILRGEHEQ